MEPERDRWHLWMSDCRYLDGMEEAIRRSKGLIWTLIGLKSRRKSLERTKRRRKRSRKSQALMEVENAKPNVQNGKFRITLMVLVQLLLIFRRRRSMSRLRFLT